MSKDDVRHQRSLFIELGRSSSRDDLPPAVPMRKHATDEMKAKFVDLFVETNPAEFEVLKTRLSEESDLLETIKTFLDFLSKSDFDQSYDPFMIFFALIERARAES